MWINPSTTITLLLPFVANCTGCLSRFVFFCVCGGNSFMFASKSCRDFTYLSGRRPSPLHSALIISFCSAARRAFSISFHFAVFIFVIWYFFFFFLFRFLPSNQRTMKSHKQDEASGCCVMVFIVSVNGFCEIATGPLLDVAPLLLLILINAQRLTQIIALLLLKQTLGLWPHYSVDITIN